MADLHSDIAHLLRRAGFGASAETVERYAAVGYEGAVEDLCDLSQPDPAADAVAPPQFDTQRYLATRDSRDPVAREAAESQARLERRQLVAWWLQRMVAAQRPLREKLTWLWHDHFAVSMEKVRVAAVMHLHWQTLHRHGPGRFDDLVDAMARDAAMLIWLDGSGSTAAAPNENFARELFELFTLGHGGTDHGGHQEQPYTESDVQEAARALTGWVIDRTDGSTAVDHTRHDSGQKQLFGVTGNLDLHDVVRSATQHEACAPHVVARLYSRIARPVSPDNEVVRELAAPFARDLDVTALLRRMLLHPDFRAPHTRAALVKAPVEYVVGSARALGLTQLDERAARLTGRLGQVPFYPPDVAGWPANEAWVSTATANTRLLAATTISQSLRIASLEEAPAAKRPDVAAELLGVAEWGPVTSAALAEASDDPKLLLTLALVAPEYLTN